jgi:hypothetical protein
LAGTNILALLQLLHQCLLVASTWSGFRPWLWASLSIQRSTRCRCTSEPTCYFWDDLGYTEIAILKALRFRFTHMEAWQPGYDPMLERLAQGDSAQDAGKQEQLDPVDSGCYYADERLLPALRSAGRFLDQEAIPGSRVL